MTRLDPAPNRGRVVMLVDNDVRRDSRVQKQARSMAERGWDVVLLGRAGRKKPESWRIGAARVRLLPTTKRRRRHQLRSPRWRDPLAYPSEQVADYRGAAVAARRVDLSTQRAMLRDRAGDSGVRRGLARWLHTPAFWLNRLSTSWVAIRAARTAHVIEARRTMASQLDRATTRAWHRLLGGRSWRALDPGLWDLELTFGPVIDSLEPDLIHANDFRMLGPAVRAKFRAADRRRAVKVVWDVHEFLPGINPWNAHPRWHLAQLAHEREFAPYADAVVTVSEELGDLLVSEHALAERPAVVMNCPVVGEPPSSHDPTIGIREQCAVGDEIPILVYSGSVSEQRGLKVAVEALPRLPDVLLAIVSAHHDAAPVEVLMERAQELGIADRVRLLDYVPFDQVVGNLTSADVGLIPIEHYPNHEIALITKFFEYAHAGLPIVVSDVRAMAHQVREHGIGEVFAAGDVDGFVRAVERVLSDPERYRQALAAPGLLEQWTWEEQADVLDSVYTGSMAD